MTSQYAAAAADLTEGILAWRIWGRLGWQEIKRRYRRTVIGPFWTTLSLGLFIFALGILWSRLWKQDPKTYLPFLSAGVLAWTLVAAIITDGCSVFVAGDSFIKQLRFPYTILSCSVAWRSLIVFLHNLVIFVAVAVYAGVPVTWASFLVIPALALIWVNGIWVSTLLGLLCTRFRDVQQLVASILQVALFVTPIFWSSEQLGPRFARIVEFNVLFHYIDVVRSPLLGHAPALWTWIVVGVGTVVGWSATFWFYSRFRGRVSYWL